MAKLLPTEREALVRELAARKGLFGQGVDPDAALRDAQEQDFLAELHPKQRAFVEHASKRKVAHCGRRAGKTVALMYLTMMFGRRYPGATIPYVTLTRDQARRNFWRPLKQLNERFRLGMEFNEQRLVAKFPNGCEVHLCGAADSDSIEVFRGDKFPLVMIDEAGSFKPHIEALVLDVFDMALGDYDGTLIMTSSPSRMPVGYFHEACTDKTGTWFIAHWNILDNAFFPRWRGKKNWRELAAKFVEQKRIQFGAESARYIVEILGLFFHDQDLQYFKFSPARNTYERLQPRQWIYGLGVDFGYEDPTAFVVIAVSPYTDEMFICETFQQVKMVDTEVQAKIDELDKKYGFTKKVADYAAKQLVMGMNMKWGTGLVAAEKGDKGQQVDLMNSDWLTGKLKLHTSEQDFAHELLTVARDLDRPQDPAVANRSAGHHADRLDACRYIWNGMQRYRGKLRHTPEAEAELRDALDPTAKMHWLEAETQERVNKELQDHDEY